MFIFIIISFNSTQYWLKIPEIERRWEGGFFFFRTCSNRTSDQHDFLYDEYRVIPGIERQECVVNYPPPSSAEVKERVEL
jgi:hypothetical protein